jgi:asparagine synthase (glutamine-hydrolysing)
MCGINGIFAYHYAANPIDRAELVRSRDYMAARGPDGMGAYISEDARVGFGHRRLSIVDLSEAGAQPMASADGKLIVTFNGEIYNYRDLRARLEAKGRVFRSQCDTEVLLHLYAEKGDAMVHDLRGMFAFGIWDADRRRLFLARDPYGIKPLYYADDGWTFRFASQVKALMAGGAISRDPEPAGLVGFYLLGSVPAPFTSYLAVRSLPAGATMVVEQLGGRAPTRYHSIAAVYCEAEARQAELRHEASNITVERMRAALNDSVRHHLLADVPIGVFLSAGVDSGALVGLMSDAGVSDIPTITVAFEEFSGHENDEAPLAAKVAAHYGTDHTTRIVTRAEFESDLPRILEAMDQPSIDGVNTWFVAKAASERGLKVAISGLGGDELFGSYPSFRDVPRWVRWLAVPSRVPLLGRAFRLFASRVRGVWTGSPKAASLLELGGTYAGAYLLRRGLFMPCELAQDQDLDRILARNKDRDIIQEGLRRLRPLQFVNAALSPTPRRSFAKVAALESQLYMSNQLLRDTDWASMAHSLEVRLPLVDATLLQTIAPLTTDHRIRSRKQALASAPSNPLPAQITSRRKTGFTTPIAEWQKRVQPIDDGIAPRHEDGPWGRQWARYIAAQQAAI